MHVLASSGTTYAATAAAADVTNTPKSTTTTTTDVFPPEEFEAIFGIRMGDTIGDLVRNTWDRMTRYALISGAIGEMLKKLMLANVNEFSRDSDLPLSGIRYRRSAARHATTLLRGEAG